MNLSQLSLLTEQRKSEDDKDVRFIMKGLREEGFTPDRLRKLIANGKQYGDDNERKGFSRTRGNENMVRAGELLLSELTR